MTRTDDLAAGYRDRGYWQEQLLSGCVSAHAATKPNATAVTDGKGRLTWSELLVAAKGAAVRLSMLGVTEGDVVSTQLPNGIGIVVMHLAVELLGAVHHPLAVQFREYELNQVAGIVQPALVVHPGIHDGVDYAAIHAATNPGAAGKVVHLDEVMQPVSGQIQGFERSAARPDDGAFILNTSGTVSIKGVLHTHEEAMYSTRTVAELIGIDSDDNVVCAIPMTWGGGLAWGLRFALHHGAKLICVPKWIPAEVAQVIDEEQGSYIYGPPTLARDLLALAPEWRPSRPLKMICAGAPIPRQLCKDAASLLGLQLFPGYGQTEHLHSTLGRLGEDEERLTTTDGSPLPGVELRALDGHGLPVEPDQVGELECRGPNVAREYYAQSTLSAETFKPDGWQVTQDLGAIDAAGYLRVAGRKRDIIIRGGLNVSPREVEELLAHHPDIREAAVVGYADPRYGERVCAFVVPQEGGAPTVAELSVALSEMGVARFKHPERIEVVEALPLTTTGKVRHESLRELLR